jgi:hypothetical protein
MTERTESAEARPILLDRATCLAATTDKRMIEHPHSTAGVTLPA